jgi:imidazolonepropionase-like amidohydrolase
MGTDSSGTLCPFGAHARELELYVAHGMSPEEALATATTNAASLLDRPELGSLRPGSVGDVVVVEGNVLTEISLLAQRSNLRYIVRGGRDVSGYLREATEVFGLDDTAETDHGDS